MVKLSASSIGTFEKCPKKYQYQYIIKPDVPAKDWSHLEFGKCAHRCLELFHEALNEKVVPPTEWNNVMSTVFKKALSEFNLEILKKDLNGLKDVLKHYLIHIKTNGLPRVLKNEMEFQSNLDKYLIRGFIDRIDLVESGHYRVVDYKTNKNPKYLNNFQLLLYSIVIKEKFPDAKKISGAYILLKHKCKSLDYEFSDADIEAARQKVIDIGLSIDTREEWEKKPSKLCNWCDFNEICQGPEEEEGQEEEVKDDWGIEGSWE